MPAESDALNRQRAEREHSGWPQVERTLAEDAEQSRRSHEAEREEIREESREIARDEIQRHEAEK